MTARHLGRLTLLIALSITWSRCLSIAAPPLVVETDPLSPAEQQAQFELPPGFEIELVASDPDIGQPLNLNFDAAGRLWVTHSVEYPYPVGGAGVEPRDGNFGPLGKPPPKDRVSVISGIGTDDVRVTHFAEGLNIPIGIVPLTTGSAIGYSIPNVVRWNAADGDGKAEPGTSQTGMPQTGMSVLLGPFGNVDTHGMVNGLTRWIDGWVYACHGFRNTSAIRGTDGHEITMNSGNTFRFRPDGSRVEQFTHGQVNPFGLTFDEWGNIYTADCHSKPLTCLIPGAYYPSFGKPHDGLGFGPDMIDHAHGSTGICGPCYYAADHFPPDYRDCLYLCNPVTGIVHRDKLIWHGSTPQVDTQPDFITCKDGWFRPVDIQLGPDGALYIADFYNAVIGHYEVPLEHPKRDRVHGRVWRVTYQDDAVQKPTLPDLTKESLEQLIDRLGDPNLTVRVLTSHHIADQYGADAEDHLRTALQSDTSSDQQRVHAMWLLHRFGKLTTDDRSQLATDRSPLVRTHLARILSGLGEWTSPEKLFAAMLLQDENALVRRAAAEAWAAHPTPGIIQPLIRNLSPADSPDTHLRHAMRIALRNCLQQPGVLAARTQTVTWSPDVASVCLAIPLDASASYLLGALKLRQADQTPPEWVTHIAQHGSDDIVGSLVSLLRDRTRDSLPRQLAAIRAIEDGQSRRSSPRHDRLTDWATEAARQLLRQTRTQPGSWNSIPLPAADGQRAKWGIEVRTATDGQPTRLWSSLPGGEQGVGIHQSPAFELPEKLTFWIAGHDGFPQEEAAGQNLVRLIRDGDRKRLRSVPVPRQDAPVEVVWEFADDVGQTVHVELVDRLGINAFAWTAAGRFSMAALNPTESVPSQLAAELIGTLHLDELRPDVERIIADVQTPSAAVGHLAAAHLQLNPDVRLQALLPWLESSPASSLARSIREQLLQRDAKAIDELLKEAMRSASSGRQQMMAQVLAGRREGAWQLVELVTAGHASPRLLASATVLQKLTAVSNQPLRNRIAELIRDLPPADERLARLIGKRRAGFDPEAASVVRGQEVFKKNCAVCHQIGSEGKKVGPQLDGVGIRGIGRLLEDLLDPNRNVDAAFRSTTLLTTDGRVLTGLLRREEGQTLVLADAKGEEFRVPMSEIDERALSPLSLMPEDVTSKLPPAELYDLLAFLLAQTQKAVK